MSSTIDPSLYLANNKREVKTGNQALGKDEFLKLLITQLQNQDPSNPMEDREFIAQMATFTSLEQMTNLNSSMQKFIEMQTNASMANYFQFLGKEVSWEKVESDGDSETETVQTGNGVVSEIEMEGDNIVLLLEDGTKVSPNEVMTLQGSGNAYAAASTLIGKVVTTAGENNEMIEAIVKAAQFQNGKTTFELDNGTTIKPEQILKIAMEL